MVRPFFTLPLQHLYTGQVAMKLSGHMRFSAKEKVDKAHHVKEEADSLVLGMRRANALATSPSYYTCPAHM
jgi:hypothetical protein